MHFDQVTVNGVNSNNSTAICPVPSFGKRAVFSGKIKEFFQISGCFPDFPFIKSI